MLKRLLYGLLKGSLVGGVLAYALVAGLSVTTLTGALAYLAVILAGVATAVVAGRPIWATGARIEVLLKTVAAALLSSGFLFLARRYFPAQMDLGALGSGPLVELPYVLLPTVSTLLAVFFELDNDGPSGDEPTETTQPSDRRLRVKGELDEETFPEEEEDEAVIRAQRR